MLDPVHDHDVGCVIDAIDDPVVAPPGREKPVELSDERLAESVRVLADPAPDGDEGSIGTLVGGLSRLRTPSGVIRIS